MADGTQISKFHFHLSFCNRKNKQKKTTQKTSGRHSRVRGSYAPEVNINKTQQTVPKKSLIIMIQLLHNDSKNKPNTDSWLSGCTLKIAYLPRFNHLNKGTREATEYQEEMKTSCLGSK